MVLRQPDGPRAPEAPHGTNTTGFRRHDVRRRQDWPSCPVLLRRFGVPTLASSLANFLQNKSPARRFCRAVEKISRGNRGVDPHGPVAAQNLRRQRNSLTAGYADSKECTPKTGIGSEKCINLRNLWMAISFRRLH